jgi:D-alanyl-D-alanine carboxypeptidase
VDATAKELLVPGAVVILSTPGRVHGLLRYHDAGRDDPSTADTHFRLALHTKAMTSL